MIRSYKDPRRYTLHASVFHQEHEVVARGPSRREALPREGALAVERVIDCNRLVIRCDDHDGVGLFGPADGFEAEVGYRVLTARDEALQFVILERVLGCIGEAE